MTYSPQVVYAAANRAQAEREAEGEYHDRLVDAIEHRHRGTILVLEHRTGTWRWDLLLGLNPTRDGEPVRISPDGEHSAEDELAFLVRETEAREGDPRY